MPVRESKSKRRPPAAAAIGPVPRRPAPASPLPFLERYAIVLAIVLIALGSARIVATYPVFSYTWDEPGHIASGIEWLSKGIYQFDQEHPPLSRVAVALGPYLSGIRPQGTAKTRDRSISVVGRKVLFSNNRYPETLFLARLGNLPFYWAACVVVFLWSKRYFGRAAAVLALFLFSFFPAVLAHAGLATTDMACTAMLGAVFLAGCVLLEEPSAKHAALFGVCGGLAVLSKFSVLAFFPASAVLSLLAYIAVERPKRGAVFARAKLVVPLVAVAAPIAAVMVWAAYRFSLAHGLPAPEFWSGIGYLLQHNSGGHWSYLLGHISDTGFWYFFPVAIAVKTPLAFLLLAVAGAWLALRKRGGKRLWLPFTHAAGILAVGMWSDINIGLRHILPMYIGLAVLGGAALAHLSTHSRATLAIGAVLVAWMAAASLFSHPDYLAYFNELAAGRPQKFLTDSDLDWGQDVARLGRRLHELGAHEVTFLPGDLADLSAMPEFKGITVNSTMSWALPTAGWNAVGFTELKQWRLGFAGSHPELTLWPDVIPPAERVGKSILLWYVPAGGSTPTIPFPAAGAPAPGGAF